MKTKHFITIGTFDGVHAGHRFLFNRLNVLAAHHLQAPLVLYFPLPPKTLLSPRPEMTVLTTPDEKRPLLQQASAAKVIALDFEKIHNQTPQEFFNELLTRYQMGGLLIGKDFAFGKDRQGSAEFLRTECLKRNIPFEVLDFLSCKEQKISSSLIRKTLAAGDIAQANAFLGRPYEVTGTVIVGNKLGRTLGFPTANLDTGIYKILPLGVFAVKVAVEGKMYQGFCNIGFRPTVNTIQSSIPLVEVNIFDFNQDIYGKQITVYFYDKLRDETKFNGLDALVTQLKKDRTEARCILRTQA